MTVSTTLPNDEDMNIGVGDKVRSYDFAEDREASGEMSCYAEGVVEEIRGMDGCRRYIIKVSKRVFGGRDRKVHELNDIVNPPVNGLKTKRGGITNQVELLEKSDA